MVLDLIYIDCVIHIFCLTASLRHSVIQIFCVTASLSLIFIAGLISADLTLPHLAALVTSNVLNFFFIETGATSMTVGRFLRLLSIVKSSEEAGIQLMGSDD